MGTGKMRVLDPVHVNVYHLTGQCWRASCNNVKSAKIRSSGVETNASFGQLRRDLQGKEMAKCILTKGGWLLYYLAEQK